MSGRARTAWLLVAGLAALVAVVVVAASGLFGQGVSPATSPPASPDPSPSARSPLPGVQRDLYVAKTGDDQSGDGSLARPWLTLQRAADSVAPGDVVSVGPGLYDERVTIPVAAGGSDGRPTRFVADGAVTVTGGLDVQCNHAAVIGFTIARGSQLVADVPYDGQVLVQGSHVTLEGLQFYDITRGSAICLLATASHITIDRCTIVKPKEACISTTNTGDGRHPSHVTVRDCVMKRWGGEVAIYAYGDHWRIEGCEIQGIDAGWQGEPVWNGDGIWANYSTESVIRGCRIYDIWPYKGFASGQHADCIQLWTGTSGLLIDGCTLGSWKPGGPDGTPGPTMGIMFGTVSAGSTCEATIENCVFLDGIAANTHPTATGLSGGSTLDLRFINNTFFGNFPELSHTSSIVLRNNVFYSHRGFGESADSDYNAFLWNPWEGGPSRVPSTEGPHSLGRTWDTRLNAADIFVDPAVDAQHEYGLTADFHPQGVLLGTGDPTAAPAHDITGAARSATAPSIGAYE